FSHVFVCLSNGILKLFAELIYFFVCLRFSCFSFIIFFSDMFFVGYFINFTPYISFDFFFKSFLSYLCITFCCFSSLLCFFYNFIEISRINDCFRQIFNQFIFWFLFCVISNHYFHTVNFITKNSSRSIHNCLIIYFCFAVFIYSYIFCVYFLISRF